MLNGKEVTAVMAFVLVFGAMGVAIGCSESTTEPTAVVYTASLNAANEKQVSPVVSSATGSATLTLRGNDSLDFTVMAAGLSAAAIASHIHVGGVPVSGPIVNGFVINSGVTTGTVASGTVVLSKLVAGPSQVNGDSLRTLLDNGNAYVNVHTSTYTGGEIRGQVVRQ
jgi:Cu/Zn superoxide dismutase